MDNHPANPESNTELNLKKDVSKSQDDKHQHVEASVGHLTSEFVHLDQNLMMKTSRSVDSKNEMNRIDKKSLTEQNIESGEIVPLSQGIQSTCLSNQSNLSDNEGEETSQTAMKKAGSTSINSDTFSYDLSPWKKDFKSIEIKPIRNLLPEFETSSLSSQYRSNGATLSKNCSPCVGGMTGSSQSNSSVKPSNLKGLIREFKKYFIKDFRSFEKERTCPKPVNNLPFCKALQNYLEVKMKGMLAADSSHASQGRCSMHYSLGLLINPKFVLSCTHSDNSCTAGQNECKILIQDLLLKCTINRIGEYFKCDNTKALFLHFCEKNAQCLSKYGAEDSLVRSLF
ncbi:unnamed protein product [Moneuplotes crassus]|uniref:Uncharacterized protein n=1 Tax=Euplotes crassus TaxID=5936 RepID=A0AAD1XYJ1_EUPCR|nr:unnamed protein product [Moneuplotes crassus]